MKNVSIFLFASLFACSFQGKDDASTKFAIKKKQSHYYAQYTFSHADYDDVEVAVRIEVSAGKPSKMEVKELTPPANSPVEIVVLRASGTEFVGTSSGAVGGEYSVKLVEGVCCGAITFVPAADRSANFVGTKSKDLTAAEWEELIVPKEYFHAQYKFTHVDYDDVEVAVRIEHIANAPSRMEMKDLTPPANSSVETLILSVSDTAFVGTSSGAVGGEYSVELAEGVCCGAITFVPAADTSATFVGTKSKDLTAEEWATLSGQAVVAGGDAALSPSDLGTKQIGAIFSVTASDGNSNDKMFLQAHDSNGAKIDQALARWTAVHGNAYDVSVTLVNGQGKFDVFLTERGQNVSKLLSFVNGNKKGETTLKAAAQIGYQRPKFEAKSNGVLSFEYTDTEWQSKRNKGLEVMIVDAAGKVVTGDVFAVNKYSEEVVTIGGVKHIYYHSHLITTAANVLKCTGGVIAFARIAGEGTVYQTDCN